jgi:hypothetical protein
MTISSDDLFDVLESLSSLQRFAKKLTGDDHKFAFLTFPQQARQELNKAHLIFAAQQLLLDPEPVPDMALHMALLRYLYPCQGNSPCVSRGLRSDLPQRLAAAGTFTPLQPVPAEHRAFALPPARTIQPPPKTRTERIESLLALAAATGVVNPLEPAIAAAAESQLAEA